VQAALFVQALICFLFVTLLAVRKRWPVISRSARLFARTIPGEVDTCREPTFESFFYFGRHLEFVTRRCFFHYALLFFALFNIMNLAFGISAIAANLVWPIAHPTAVVGAQMLQSACALLAFCFPCTRPYTYSWCVHM
jgi:hypothetical protein